MASKMTHEAEYLYPGVLFPESRNRLLEEPTYAAALAAQPDDRWYALRIKTVTWKLFTADDGETEWVRQDSENAGSWIVGEKIHYTDIPDTAENRILRSNLRSNDPDGFGVKTRLGNWQPAGSYDHVVSA